MAVYRIETHVNYVEAENRRAALTFARKETKATELSSKEIVGLANQGKAIIDAATGEVVGEEIDEPEAQP